jgi:hypothetical protein
MQPDTCCKLCFGCLFSGTQSLVLPTSYEASYNGFVELHVFDKTVGSVRCGGHFVIYNHVFLHPSSSESLRPPTRRPVPSLQPASLIHGSTK